MNNELNQKPSDTLALREQAITDEQIGEYASFIISAEFEPEQCMKKAFGFIPTAEQIREIERSTVYRDHMDSILTALQSRLMSNTVMLADAALIEAATVLKQTRQVINELFEREKFSVKEYSMLCHIQIKLFASISSEIQKANQALQDDNDDDRKDWDDILQNDR